MSHSVTIQTRTVTTGNPSLVNFGFCKSWTGILKLAQVILGIISVILVTYYLGSSNNKSLTTEKLFFLLIATSFLIGSAIMVLSCLCSYTTESIISKTIFELLYHAFAFGLVLAASITLLTKVEGDRWRSKDEDLQMGAAICGLINSALYLLSTIIALRTSRGL